MRHALYSGLGGKQNRQLKIVLSDGKGVFSFPKRTRQAEDRSPHQPRRPRSPPGCRPSSGRGRGTHRCWRGNCGTLFKERGSDCCGSAARSRSSYTTRGRSARSATRSARPAGRGRAARDPQRALGGKDRGGLSGPHSRGLYDTALARGTGRGWPRRRKTNSRCKSRGEPRAELS